VLPAVWKIAFIQRFGLGTLIAEAVAIRGENPMRIASIAFANAALPLRGATAAPRSRNDGSVANTPNPAGAPPAPGSVTLTPAGRDRTDAPTTGAGGTPPSSIAGSFGSQGRHIIFA
jgi:hypothetical protein